MVVPEGNGKSTFMAGFVLYHADYTPDASVVIGASSRDQCRVLHNQAAGFIRRSGIEGKRFRIFDGYLRIQAYGSNGQIQVFAADDRTGDGVIPSLALLEELHRHRDLRLYRTWNGKMLKRGGQTLAISTAGEPGSEFELIRQRIKETARHLDRDGAHTRAEDGGVVLHDWAVPPDADIENMADVKAANPLSTITEKDLEEKRSSLTMTIPHWRRFVCNQAVRDSDSAIEEGEWAAAATDEMIPVAQSIGVGIDLAWKHDCTALVPLWIASREHRLFGIPKILTPPRDGGSLHPEEVRAAFRSVAEINPVHTVVMDITHGGNELRAWIQDEYPDTRVVEYPQSDGTMAMATESFLEALREGWIKHPGDPEFTRHVMNARARLLNNGRTRFDRASSSRSAGMQDRRVWDALTAAAMVHVSLAAEDVGTFDYSDFRFEVL